MQAAGLLGMLGICSYEDIKTKKIGIVVVLLFAIFGVINRLLMGSPSIYQMLGGMLVGGFLFVVGLIFKGCVGPGDALMVMASGIYLGLWDNLLLLWISTGLAGIAGLYFIIKGKKNEEIPFAPFLLIGYVLMLVLKGGTNVS